MNISKYKFILIFTLVFTFIYQKNVFSSHDNIIETDHTTIQLFSIFDLRERESFIQVTSTNSSNITIHVQIFNVNQNCNENNFYDTLTPNDTHIYNMRDILTNNGNPSGVVLPENAYGTVAITYVSGVGQESVSDNDMNRVLFGNFRIVDNNGYEYRTNSAGRTSIDSCPDFNNGVDTIWYFNFNIQEGVTLSDIFLLALGNTGSGNVEVTADPLDEWMLFDVDIYDVNENPFSCRNIISACIEQDDPLLESLLQEVADSGSGSASVASFEYGINDAIPNTKGSELLCPGNTIQEGVVKLDQIDESTNITSGFVGLNNGNGRGSIDQIFSLNCALTDDEEP